MSPAPSQPDAPRGRMPVLFIGHGSPMNAIEDNEWSRAFRAVAATIPKPRAVLVVSAHWFVPGTLLTADERPATIHDFSGFPRELAELRYPAPGDPELANRVVGLIGAGRAALSGAWGLDHGAWSVLRHLFPDAATPIVQLSMDDQAEPADHLALGRALAPLRDDGVLILGSGNITHNLRTFMEASRRGDVSTPDWAAGFDGDVATALTQHDDAYLTSALDSERGRICHPSPDHYLPLLYAAGAADRRDRVSFPITGFAGGSLSMRAVRFG